MRINHSKEEIEADFDWEKLNEEIFSNRRKNNLETIKKADNLYFD
jgi:hypothetical protein